MVVRPTHIQATIFPTNVNNNMDYQHVGRQRLLWGRGEEDEDDEDIEEGYMFVEDDEENDV